MTCAQMGGPATCGVVLTGNTAEEMVKNGTDHVTQNHPDLAEQIKKMSSDDTAKWWAGFKIKFDALPEM